MQARPSLILLYLAIKMLTEIRRHPADETRLFAISRPREGMYTTLLMSTGLTFGSISAPVRSDQSLRIIDQQQYTILVTAVIASAMVPTLITLKMVHTDISAACQTIEAGLERAPETFRAAAGSKNAETSQNQHPSGGRRPNRDEGPVWVGSSPSAIAVST